MSRDPSEDVSNDPADVGRSASAEAGPASPAPPVIERPGDANPSAPEIARRAATRPFRLWPVVAIILIVVGLALLFVTLRAQDLGLATTAGASRTQVTTGVAGTVLVAIGLALIVQPFGGSDEPPSR